MSREVNVLGPLGASFPWQEKYTYIYVQYTCIFYKNWKDIIDHLIQWLSAPLHSDVT